MPRLRHFARGLVVVTTQFAQAPAGAFVSESPAKAWAMGQAIRICRRSKAQRVASDRRRAVNEINSVSRYEEAARFVESVQEPKLRAALEYALATVVMRRGMSPAVEAASDFDLRYFLEAIKAMFERDVVIRAIIDGNEDALRW